MTRQYARAAVTARDFQTTSPVSVRDSTAGSVQPVKSEGVATALADLRAPALAIRALMVCAAGGHHALFIGPPEGEKDRLVDCLRRFLPKSHELAMSDVPVLGARKRGAQSEPVWYEPPHAFIDQNLIGVPPHPGLLASAHHGTLCLRPLTEFRPLVLEAVMQAIKESVVETYNEDHSEVLRYPLHCQLIATMSPCACGYFGDFTQACKCCEGHFVRHRQRVPAPLYELMDVRVNVSRLDPRKLNPAEPIASDDFIAKHLRRARQRQLDRQGVLNARLTDHQLLVDYPLGPRAGQVLAQAAEEFTFRAVDYSCVRKLARTIADLAGAPTPTAQHVVEAVQLRHIAV